MSILSRPRRTIKTVDSSRAQRIERVACPRCAAVNCTRHSAGTLTTRAVPAHWRAGA